MLIYSMNLFYRFLLTFALLLTSLQLFAAGIVYQVDFEGVPNPTILKTIKAVSQLTTLKKRSPPSINALRYRAESDIPELLKVLHAHGYYEATVKINIEEIFKEIQVTVSVDPGPVYEIENYTLWLYHADAPVTCEQVNLDSIGITLGKPALAEQVLNSELTLLRLLANCGYPLAEIKDREMIADGDTKGIRIKLEVDTGPPVTFGKIHIQGLMHVNPRFILQKTSWKEGDVYDSRQVESTQKILMDTGLFSSVMIRHEEDVDEKGQIALRIEVTESKHKSINLGVIYQTFYGLGLTFGWENRDVGGMGRKLSLQGDFTKRSHSGLATYLIPDFHRIGQDSIWQAQAMHQSITAFSERTYNLAHRIERKIGKHIRISVGAKLERLYVTESVHNGNYVLFEIPFYFRWSSANSLLNPTRGSTFEYRATPSLNTSSPKEIYLFQELSECFYFPLAKSEAAVLAQKITWGTIASERLNDVPVSKRLFGGSDDDLRGYRYLAVSPLKHHKPEGGRSAIFYTAETRFRVTQTIGLVPFFDLGLVQTTQLPHLKGKWFKSVGLGIRYFSFIGPIRLDFAFPLDRRKGIDPVYRILVSIGQTF